MIIFIQGEETIKKLGLRGNSIVELKQIKKAKKNEFVFYNDGGLRFKIEKYKKVRHLETSFYKVMNIHKQ